MTTSPATAAIRTVRLDEPPGPSGLRRDAAKARYAQEGVKPPPAAAPAERTPYQEVSERLAAIQPPLPEYFLTKAAKRLGWVPEQTNRLADLDPKALGVLITGWTDLVKQARTEEHGTAETAAA